MNFQARLILALLAIAAVPMGILGFGVRRELTARVDAEAAAQVNRVQAAVTMGVTEIATRDRRRLESLAADLATEGWFRVAVVSESPLARARLIDWAATTMRLAGFAVLRVHDSAGTALSVGESRDDAGRGLRATVDAITASSAKAAVVDARGSSGPVRALVAMASFAVGADTFRIVGGTAFDSARVARLAPDTSVAVHLRNRTAPPEEGAIAVATFPLVDELATQTDAVQLVLIPDLGPTQALRAGVTRWLFVTFGATVLIAIVAAALIARVVSAPVASLADRTSRLDLDKLDLNFSTDRTDEIGALSRTLDALTGRLRTSVGRLREAERAAATGDLARQVNHDIKNGLAPIRNVLRHLAQTAEREPEKLAAIYLERRETIDSSIEYLDQLARNYARISPVLGRSLTDPRALVLDIAQGVSGARVEVNVPERLPLVRADAVAVRRILDNVISNAVDALDGLGGKITITVSAAEDRVRFAVTDTGRGMTKQELDRAFDDFYTTKPAGTGLGLSVVRRILTDLGGSVRAETAPGKGTTFTVEIPSASQ
jgi:signal transduction histidine kinase